MTTAVQYEDTTTKFPPCLDGHLSQEKTHSDAVVSTGTAPLRSTSVPVGPADVTAAAAAGAPHPFSEGAVCFY